MDLLQMSFSGAAIILVIVVVRSLALYKLPKKSFLMMWGVALARLLIPLRISSPFSVYALLERSRKAEVNYMAPYAVLPVELPDVVPAIPDAGQVTIATRPPDLSTVLIIVWLVGMAVCALCFIMMYIRCHREFQISFPVQSGYVNSWLACRQIKRTISIRQTDLISAPVSYGVFHPVILLPKTFDLEDENALQYVLTHEYVHIRRFDALTKGIIILAVCVHWFNPLVWVMYILANRDMELICDEAVIRWLGQEAKSGYAGVLIAMVETKLYMASLGNHFSRTAIEERIAAIARPQKMSLLTTALALLLTVCTIAAFATSPVIPGWEDEQWAGEYRELIIRQAAVDYVNGEKMGKTYLLDRQTYMEGYVPPDRGMAIVQAVAILEQAMHELEPGETRHFRLDAWDGSSIIEVYARSDYRVEIYAQNGDPLATLTSASYEWKYHYTATERQFAKQSDALYLESYRAAERAGITEAEEPPFSVPFLDTVKYYFGGPEKTQQLAEVIRQRLDAERAARWAGQERTGMIENEQGQLVPVSSLSKWELERLEAFAVNASLSLEEMAILVAASNPNGGG